MSRRVLLAVLASVVLLEAATVEGCAGSIAGPDASGLAGSGPGDDGPSAAAGATAGGAGSGAGTGDLGVAGAPATPDGGIPIDATCLQVRMCVAQCPDAACAQRCIERGSASARMLFEQLQACSTQACPNQQDRTCRCEAECIFPGACAELQDMCTDGLADPACAMCA